MALQEMITATKSNLKIKGSLILKVLFLIRKEDDLNFQVHLGTVWLSQVCIHSMSGNNVDPITSLNKGNPSYIFSTNIHIDRALIPAPVIFRYSWRLVFDLKRRAAAFATLR